MSMSIIPKRGEFEKPPQPLTFLLCKSCNTENSRPFKQNDYIFKEITGEEKCPKCGATDMVIVNIYIPDEKEKKEKK